MIVLIDWRNTGCHSLSFGAWIFRWRLYDWYDYGLFVCSICIGSKLATSDILMVQVILTKY